ncbi:MAG: tetratricopeptide repeat protein [Planctomycetes bacterium]|nr:tetratricopeptide repeat protein [Planctomycetota bacterium]
MRCYLVILLSLGLLAGCSSQGRGSGRDGPPPRGDPPWMRDGGKDGGDSVTAQSGSLEEMLEHDDFDLPRALLLFSKAYAGEFESGDTPPLDVDAVLARYQAYTDELKKNLKRERSPRSRLLALIEFVDQKLHLRFDSGDAVGHNPQNLFFDQVINRRQGYCVTLSLAYIVFGQAAGLDVRGVRIPGHFAVQFREEGDEPYEVLIESTTGGTTLDPVQIWSRHRFSKQAVDGGSYLTPLSDRGILSTLYNNLAGLTHLSGRNELAIKRYTYAIELASNNIEAYYNRALVQRRMGEMQPALRDLNEALRLDPNFTLAVIARAGVLWEAGEKAAAREDLNLALRQRGDWPECYLLDGAFLAQEGQLEAARDAYTQALKLDENIPEAHKALARIERLLGNEDAAHEHEQAAERLKQ